jgi:phage anti-repressor protein
MTNKKVSKKEMPEIQDLIKIEPVNGIETVNARELHKFLESKRDFSTWIKAKIDSFGFIENEDYIRIHKKVEANNATLIDYHISIDMAKDLSMVENNAKGAEARTYFKNCEKQLKIVKENLPKMIESEVKRQFENYKPVPVKIERSTEKKEKAVIVKKYNLYGRIITIVKFRKIEYQVCPNYYIPAKFDLRYDDREVGSEIKKGFFSFEQAIRFIEKNM